MHFKLIIAFVEDTRSNKVMDAATYRRCNRCHNYQ